MKKNVLIIGEDSLLGKALKANLKGEKQYNVFSTSRSINSELYLNLNDPHDIALEKFDVIIFLAGITNIDYCEQNKHLCFQTNVKSTIRLISEMVSKKCFVIFLSSNSVFDGTKSFYMPDDKKNPTTNYGIYKSIVEDWIIDHCSSKVSILRCTKILPDNSNPKFVDQWINEISIKGYSEAYTNHFFSPIYESEAVKAIKSLIHSMQGGIFHKGSEIECSYADYAKNFFSEKPDTLKKIRMIKKGNRDVYNSLQTSLPSCLN